MRTTHLLLASAACALLMGCDGGALTAPDADPLGYTDVQCPDSSCGGTPVTPHYDFGSQVRSYDEGHIFELETFLLKGRSWSDINSDRYTYATVSATARIFKECKPEPSTVWGTQSNTVYGVGRAEVVFRYESQTPQWDMRVNATHFFKASPSYPWLTDLTFQSADSYC